MQSTMETPPAVSPSISVSPPHPRIDSEQRVILRGVSWATYESLLVDFAGRSSPRFAYDQGVLEIMPLSFPHENMNRLLQDLFSAVADEQELDFVNAGSTTFKRADLAKGFEPDTCFYIANAERMRGKPEVDLTVDPPPDLVIEIDITSLSLNKFPIYAQIGVPEVWRYAGNQVTIFKLSTGEYFLQNESPALPGLTSEVISRFLEEGQTMTHLAWLRSIREWARQQRSQHTPSKEGD
jgi:Uma2 family endonuclease